MFSYIPIKMVELIGNLAATIIFGIQIRIVFTRFSLLSTRLASKNHSPRLQDVLVTISKSMTLAIRQTIA